MAEIKTFEESLQKASPFKNMGTAPRDRRILVKKNNETYLASYSASLGGWVQEQAVVKFPDGWMEIPE